MPQNRDLELQQAGLKRRVEVRNGQPKEELQPPKLVVSKGTELNSRDILAKLALNPRANLYLT